MCLFSLDSKTSTLSIVRKILLLDTTWFNGGPSILRSHNKVRSNKERIKKSKIKQRANKKIRSNKERVKK
jgi:hypothetical protein